MGNRRIIRPSCAIIYPPRRIIDRVYSFTEAVEGKIKYFQGRHEPVPAYKNISPVYGINKNLGGNQQAKTLKKFQVARGCQTDACKFYSGQETIDMNESCGESFLKLFSNYFWQM